MGSPTNPARKWVHAQAYYKHIGRVDDELLFLHDGMRLRDEQTPADLDMEDGDSLDVMMEQVGGK